MNKFRVTGSSKSQVLEVVWTDEKIFELEGESVLVLTATQCLEYLYQILPYWSEVIVPPYYRLPYDIMEEVVFDEHQPAEQYLSISMYQGISVEHSPQRSRISFPLNELMTLLLEKLATNPNVPLYGAPKEKVSFAPEQFLKLWEAAKMQLLEFHTAPDNAIKKESGEATHH